MILICDNEITERTKALRKKIYESGLPCAAVRVKEMGQYLPAKLIICYYEAFDPIRHGPYDDIHAIVIGKGFVNSALNAVRVDNEDEACVKAKEYIRKIFSIGEREQFFFGDMVDSSVFLAKKHFSLYGNIVEPTRSEYMIFKYFLAFGDKQYYFTPLTIRKFCYIRELHHSDNLDGNISVHISNLNHKIEKATGKQFIKAKRYCGYYSLGID